MWHDRRQLGLLTTKEVVTLHTACTDLPLTISSLDWQADLDDIDCGEYDGETGTPIYTGTVAFGGTESEAIANLFDRIECNALQFGKGRK